MALPIGEFPHKTHNQPTILLAGIGPTRSLSSQFSAPSSIKLPDNVHIEPRQAGEAPAPSAGHGTWATRIAGFLQLAPVFAGFLTGQLGLHSAADPAPQAAVRLEAPKDIEQLISPGDLESLPGGRHLRQAAGYFIATSDGAATPDAAACMITDVLRYALSADA